MCHLRRGTPDDPAGAPGSEEVLGLSEVLHSMDAAGRGVGELHVIPAVPTSREARVGGGVWNEYLLFSQQMFFSPMPLTVLRWHSRLAGAPAVGLPGATCQGQPLLHGRIHRSLDTKTTVLS